MKEHLQKLKSELLLPEESKHLQKHGHEDGMEGDGHRTVGPGLDVPPGQLEEIVEELLIFFAQSATESPPAIVFGFQHG